MNSLHKSLTIAFMTVSIVILGFNIDPVGAQNTAGEKKSVAELSDAEQAWLAKHASIKLGFNPDMQPLLIQEHEVFEVMARFLGVEYIYEELDETAAPTESVELTSAMLAELPPELLQELDKKALVANREAIFEVIERIAEHAPDMAKSLQTLVQNFEIERIRELLEEA